MSTTRLRFAALVTCCLVAMSGCSSDPGDEAAATASSTTAPSTTTTTTVATTTTLEVVTTIRRVPADELGSVGSISVGNIQYDFAFECYTAGAGDILALGVGEDPTSNQPTQAIVQAFLGQPYVAVLIGEASVLELAIDQPAELFVQGDAIQGSALRFVEAGESAGVGDALGLGMVSVACQGFAPGLPEGYVTS